MISDEALQVVEIILGFIYGLGIFVLCYKIRGKK